MLQNTREVTESVVTRRRPFRTTLRLQEWCFGDWYPAPWCMKSRFIRVERGVLVAAMVRNSRNCTNMGSGDDDNHQGIPSQYAQMTKIAPDLVMSTKVHTGSNTGAGNQGNNSVFLWHPIVVQITIPACPRVGTTTFTLLWTGWAIMNARTTMKMVSGWEEWQW